MKKSYSILCLASLLMASCSQEQEETQLTSQEKPVYLQVDLEPLSRATLLKELPSECEYGISCNFQRSKVNYVKGTSTIVDPIALDKTYQQVFAYYPWSEFNEGMIQEEDFVSFNVLEDIDCLWGTSVKDVNYANPKAYIHFQHVFANVNFVIRPNQYLEESLKKELVVDYIEVGELPLYCFVDAKGIYRIFNFEYLQLKTEEPSLAQGDVNVRTLCCPTKDRYNSWNEYTKPISISIFFKGHKEPAVVKIPRNKWSMESGKKYTYNITINGLLEAELSETVYVRPWNDGENLDFIIK